MTAREKYQERQQRFASQVQDLEKRDVRLSRSRLIFFLAAVAVTSLLSDLGAAPAAAFALVAIIVFAGLIIHHERIVHQLQVAREFLGLNQREADKFSGPIPGLDGGDDFVDPLHPGSMDLSLFGRASLFEHISRAETRDGRQRLADWLQAPAPFAEIQPRQQAVAELAADLEFRQRLQVTVRLQTNRRQDPSRLTTWAETGSRLPRHGLFRLAVKLLPVATAVCLLSGFAGDQPKLRACGVILLIIQFLFILFTERRVHRLWRGTSGCAGSLRALAEVALLVEPAEFNAPALQKIQDEFGRGAAAATLRLQRVAGILDWLALRMSMLHFPVNLLLLFDLQFCLRLDNERQFIGDHLGTWFSELAKLEALSSLAVPAHDHPDWCFPGLVEPTTGHFAVENLGHPLLPDDRRVGNDFSLQGNGVFRVLTGSNMAGKSTFLRSVGLAMVMGSCGAPVAAASARLSPVPVHAAMSARDSLERGISSFLAELERLRGVLEAAKQGPILALLDEMLKGTHSGDQHRGSVALLEQLAGYGGMALVATHDLQLAEVAETMTGWQGNICLVGDVTPDGDVNFDYRLRDGICRQHTAVALMRKMGISV